MIKVKRSQLIRKPTTHSDLITKFAAVSLKKQVWIVPIVMQTLYDPSPDKISVQQTSIYTHMGRELIQVDLPEQGNIALFLFEIFGIELTIKYQIKQIDDIYFIFFTSKPYISYPYASWYTMLTMFSLIQPLPIQQYKNPYTAILNGYFNDIYDKWCKANVEGDIKLQNSDNYISYSMLFQQCEEILV